MISLKSYSTELLLCAQLASVTARLLVLLVVPALALAAEPVLISREALLGNPERSNARLSGDARRLAWLAPDDKNVLQVWVRSLGGKDDVAVSSERRRGVRGFEWAPDSNGLIYWQDGDGDENFHLFLVDLSTRNVRDLTPWQGVRATLLATNPRFPNTALFTANVRDRRTMDVMKVDLRTGATELDTQNPGDVERWLVDSAFVVRGALATTREGGTELRVRETAKSPWRALVTVGLEENLGFVNFTEDGRGLIVTTSIDSDTARVVEKSLKTGAERVIVSNDRSDPLETFGHISKQVLRAVAFDVAGRRAWTTTDYSVKADFEALAKALTGDFSVTSMDFADSKWLVTETRDNGPTRTWLWDRKLRKPELMFTHEPKLEGAALASVTPIAITARDGTVLNGYLTRSDATAKNRPMVLLVHGGPWARDAWGLQPTAQWLANRGYVVLQVNFRGSTGYGKRFVNLSNRQWGLSMHDDLIDAVNWAVKEGLADARHVGIMGGSYGGYATLAGLSFTPEVFACGVDMVGPSNLFTLLATVPPYWSAYKQRLVRRMGDPDDPKDKDLLTKASPLFSADKIVAPLLIGQGANDPRVKVAESEQMVAALEKKGQGVTWVVYPDEGHGFARPENRLDFYARAEVFLAGCLGGRAEPLPKDGKFPGSTGVVRVVAPRK